VWPSFTQCPAYRDDNGQPWVLPVVRAAEQALAGDTSINHEYLPVLGFEPFTQAACRLLLGDDCPQAFAEDRVGRILSVRVFLNNHFGSGVRRAMFVRHWLAQGRR